jgi:hypothetical protein
MKRLSLFALFVLLVGCSTVHDDTIAPRSKWTAEQANAWYSTKPWLVGCNFTPSTAINQLEMWQAETWDPTTIDRELGWAQDLGFTSVRVFLHHLVWQQDEHGFLKRMDQFLGLAHKHHIGVMFVFFDSCWDPHPKLGKQHEPRPHVHNSGWVQDPGVEMLSNPARHDELKPYVQSVMKRFRNDKRIDFWDIFNEPDNMNNAYAQFEPKNKPDFALTLLQKAFVWARECNPSQPISSGVWLGTWGDVEKLKPMERTQLDESDIITFHTYSKLDEVKKCVKNLERYHRPMICTEYMARPNGSRFVPILGYFREQNVGAYNWGFVAGKTQTIYPWDSWTKKYTAEPPVWFHDIFRANGEPYDRKEVDYIKSVTGKSRKAAMKRDAPATPFASREAVAAN